MKFVASEAELWGRVESFSFDDVAADFSFTQRLARDLNWSLAFAVRVVQEYRRFMFLVVVADHPVTPSDEVDQVWHLHLVYTRSYWDEFCGEVLGQAIHHGPTQGGQAERAKYADQYEKTKATYGQKFGVLPPADIWPSGSDRFDPLRRRRWLSHRDYWVIRKPDFRKIFQMESLAYAAAAAIPALICVWSPFDLAAKPFLIFYAILGIVVWFAGFLLQRFLRTDGESQWLMSQKNLELSTNHLAYLAGGQGRLLRSAVCELLVVDAAQAEKKQLKRGKVHAESAAELSSVAQIISERLSVRSKIDYPTIKSATKLAVAKISGDLVKFGLIESRTKRHVLRWVIGLMGAGALAVGFMRISQAANAKPVGFLVLEMFALGIATLILIGLVPSRTRAGENVFKHWRQKARETSRKALKKNCSPRDMSLVVGVLGVLALSGTAHKAMKREVNSVFLSSSLGDGGGEDGGGGDGGCGGGCGGCGG